MPAGKVGSWGLTVQQVGVAIASRGTAALVTQALREAIALLLKV